MDHDDDGETSHNRFVDDVAFEPTYLQALLTAAGRNVATLGMSSVRWHQSNHPKKYPLCRDLWKLMSPPCPMLPITTAGLLKHAY